MKIVIFGAEGFGREVASYVERDALKLLSFSQRHEVHWEGKIIRGRSTDYADSRRLMGLWPYALRSIGYAIQNQAGSNHHRCYTFITAPSAPEWPFPYHGRHE